jgi:hypothetical protein
MIPRIRKFNNFINEKIDQSKYQLSYEDWEKGLILAWGHLLYLGYHSLPYKINNIVPENETKKYFAEYYIDGEDDEDLRDWMSDSPPTVGNGKAIFDRNRLNMMLTEISMKTRTKEDLIVYRYEDQEYTEGWNSYTLNPDLAYYSNNKNISKKSYLIPKGHPIIFAGGIADIDEVILNLSPEEKKKLMR